MGVCSRRDAEKLIQQGQVRVDGVIMTNPATNVSEDNIVEVQGKNILSQPQLPRLWIYHKPPGLITTHKDPQGRPTVFSALKGLPRVISVGRLDLNSEGLLLLTNNGDLARKLESPKSKLLRIYKVRAYGCAKNLSTLLANCLFAMPNDKKPNAVPVIDGSPPSPGANNSNSNNSDSNSNNNRRRALVVQGTKYSIEWLRLQNKQDARLVLSESKNGNQRRNVDYNQHKSTEATHPSSRKANLWYEIGLLEGKNREVRKIFNHFGLEVNRLIRLEYGLYKLGDLKPGAYKEVDILVDF